MDKALLEFTAAFPWAHFLCMKHWNFGPLSRLMFLIRYHIAKSVISFAMFAWKQESQASKARLVNGIRSAASPLCRDDLFQR